MSERSLLKKLIFKKQVKIALRNCGFINPLNIQEYIARDGYLALGKVLSFMTPEEVIEMIKNPDFVGEEELVSQLD